MVSDIFQEVKNCKGPIEAEKLFTKNLQRMQLSEDARQAFISGLKACVKNQHNPTQIRGLLDIVADVKAIISIEGVVDDFGSDYVRRKKVFAARNVLEAMKLKGFEVKFGDRDGDVMKVIKKVTFLSVFVEMGGNCTKTAKRLGVSIRSARDLINKMTGPGGDA